MLQTVLIIIHLILIAVVWYRAGEKNSFILKNIGVCLNLAIFIWPIVNIKPEWYGNYMWFILLVPVSIFIATLLYY